MMDLDSRYIEFNRQTRDVFSSFPNLEPLRLEIFRELAVLGRTFDWKQVAKHWLRPAVRRSGVVLPKRTVDVLIHIGSAREVVVDALVPLYRALEARGVRVGLMSSVEMRGSPQGLIRFRFPGRAVAPEWAGVAANAIGEVVPGLANSSARRTLIRLAAMCQSEIDEMERVLAALSPRVVVVATPLGGGGALMAAAKRHGIRTMIVQHGMTQAFYTPVVADTMLTWGKCSNNVMIRLGVDPGKLAVVGSPRHDTMGPYGGNTARSRFLSALRLSDRPTFVFFSSGNDLLRNEGGPAECARWLEEAARRFGDEISVVARLHSQEDGSLYRNCPRVKIVYDSPDLATTLEGCDAVGALCSTVLYEGMLFRKPVWHFHADGWPMLATNWTDGLAVRISSQKDLGDQIAALEGRAFDLGYSQEQVGDVFANHGRAVDATCDFVEMALKNQRSDRGHPS